MALVMVNADFDFAGRQYRVGDVVEDDSYLYAKFPTKFTVLTLSVANSAAATALGSVTKKIEVFNAAGASLGFIPVYDAIT